MTHSRTQHVHTLAIAALALGLTPIAASAQAWVPPKGDGTVSLAAQQLNVKKHRAGTTITDAGHINTGVLVADMTYGLTDKFAVDLAVPYVVTRYSGTRPHQNTNIDDGALHNSFTDFRMSCTVQPDAKGRGDYALRRVSRAEP